MKKTWKTSEIMEKKHGKLVKLWKTTGKTMEN